MTHHLTLRTFSPAAGPSQEPASPADGEVEHARTRLQASEPMARCGGR